MSRSIYFFLLCLCASPIAAYSAEEAHKKYQITVDKLKCLHEHSETLLKGPERSFTVVFSEKCEDIAIRVEDNGPLRGPQNREIADSGVYWLTLTPPEIKCLKKVYENLEFENKANPNKIITIHFTAKCKTQVAG